MVSVSLLSAEFEITEADEAEITDSLTRVCSKDGPKLSVVMPQRQSMSGLNFATLDHCNKTKQSKRKRLLADTRAVVSQTTLLALIEPHFSKASNNRGRCGIAVMLYIFCLQQWCQLSNPGGWAKRP